MAALASAAGATLSEGKATPELRNRARELLARAAAWKHARDLKPGERHEFDRLVDEAATLNARQRWTDAEKVIARARTLAESGDLLFEAGRTAAGSGDPLKARRCFDAGATLLEAELGAAFERQDLRLQGRGSLSWAGASTIWVDDSWLYDLDRERFVALAPSTRADARIVAAAKDWVVRDGTLWNLRAATPVASVQAESAAPSADGEKLYALSGRQVSILDTANGRVLRVIDGVQRDPNTRRPAVHVAPEEDLLIIDGFPCAAVVLESGKTITEMRGFDCAVLAEGWTLTTQEQALVLRQLKTGKTTQYKWREPPYYGGEVVVSRNGRTFAVFEPVTSDSLLFELPRAAGEALKPVRIASRRGVDDTGRDISVRVQAFAPNGDLVAAKCASRGAGICLLDSTSGKQIREIQLPSAVANDLCRIGIRLYRWELCSSRTNEPARP